MKHRSLIARLLARVSVAVLATFMLAGTASAKPGADNHGAAVRVAAHCPISGSDHGKLVSSIAKNKAATVADAEAACEAALAPPECPEPLPEGTEPPPEGTELLVDECIEPPVVEDPAGGGEAPLIAATGRKGKIKGIKGKGKGKGRKKARS